MSERHERLPENSDRILAAGARLMVTLRERSEIRIEGNRSGLRALAAICEGLANLAADEVRTPASHYHLDEDFWGTENGSVPLTIQLREDGWPAEQRVGE